MVDGERLPSYSLPQWRKHVTFLSQDSDLYPLSIKENIELGISDPENINPGDAEDAARATGVFDTIQSLPERFETVLKPVTTILPTAGGCPGESSKLAALIQEIEPKPVDISGAFVRFSSRRI